MPQPTTAQSVRRNMKRRKPFVSGATPPRAGRVVLIVLLATATTLLLPRRRSSRKGAFQRSFQPTFVSADFASSRPILSRLLGKEETKKNPEAKKKTAKSGRPPQHVILSPQERRHKLYENTIRSHYDPKRIKGQGSLNETGNPYLQPDIHDKLFSSLHKRDGTERILSHFTGLPPFPPSRIQFNKQRVKEMFQHAYDSYMYHAWPEGEIKPISCTPGKFDLVKLQGLTLIDSLDMLVLLQNYTEFARATERLKLLGSWWDVDENVSVFETNIRVVGGLLSAHQLAEAFLDQKVFLRDVWVDFRNGTSTMVRIGGNGTEVISRDYVTPTSEALPFWKYDGSFLRMAEEVGRRLLPAFNTKTGIPYGTINLVHGVPKGETPIASLAGAGTLTLEFELLSRLTGDERFGKVAKLATRALWMRRSSKNLFGKHIDTFTGKWTEVLSGIGSNSDSFLEYLVKHYFLFPDDFDWWPMLSSAYSGVFHDSRIGEWYADVDMSSGLSGGSKKVFESLMAFYPGMQTLLGEIEPAARSLSSFFLVREYLGFLPERFNFGLWRVDNSLDGGAGIHPLRPELLESCYFLHRATKAISSGIEWSSGWLWAADYSLEKLYDSTLVDCGFATVSEVTPEVSGSTASGTIDVPQLDEMPSFFLSETLKYLFLLFETDDPLQNDREREWIFTTEAHPLHYPLDLKDDFFDLQELSSILENRLAGRPPLFQLKDSDSKNLWATDTGKSSYLRDIEGVYAASVGSGNEAIPEKTYPIVSHREHIDSFRTPHHVKSYHGDGRDLKKSCINVFSSSLLWNHALNGGVMEYSSFYVSSLFDDKPGPISEFFHVLGPGEALGTYGSGTFLGHSPLEEMSCPLPKSDSESDGEKAEDVPTPGVSSTQTSFGSFELLPFDQGGGFLLRQNDRGHVMWTSFLFDDPEGEGLVMVYSSFTTTESIQDMEEDTSAQGIERNVIISDFKQNSFTCNVDLILSGDSGDQIVETIPCAPGHFGPGEMKELIERNGVVEAAPLYLHTGEERFGCPPVPDGVCEDISHKIFSDLPSVCDVETTVRVVERGGCSFFEKADNVSKNYNAAGLIVVNTSWDEIFVMSNPEGLVSAADFPLTVLVTGSDGSKIKQNVDAVKSEGNKSLLARIRLTKQPTPSSPLPEISSCPLVSGTNNSLRIFTHEGWGVYASNNPTDTHGQWQIQLFSHPTNKISASSK